MGTASPYLYDSETGEKIEVLKTLIVGRSETNDLIVKDQSVSSQHAKIIRKENNIYLLDLNSFNSSYLNGEEVLPGKPHLLEEKDVVQIGDKIFYFNSDEPCQKYLELPSMTGSFKMEVEKTGEGIVHNYEEPVIDLERKKKKGTSLKELRHLKEEIVDLNDKLVEINKALKGRESFKKELEAKEKEVREFDTYLEVRTYHSVKEVDKIIESVQVVSDRLDQDISGINEKIMILKNQIQGLKDDIKSLEKEKVSNHAMVDELKNDIEIIKGREALVDEIESMKEKLINWDESKDLIEVQKIQERITEKELLLKNAQEEYANNRFGKNGIFPNKKVS